MKTKLLLLAAVIFTVFFMVGCASTSQATEEDDTPPVETPAPTPTTPEPAKTSKQAYFTKTPYFKADLSEFESESSVRSWFDAKTKELMKLADVKKAGVKLENVRFEVRGYCAIFPNNIDDKVLTRDRAQVVARALQDNGIPADKITVIPEGATRRWSSTDRRENRIATITVIVNE